MSAERKIFRVIIICIPLMLIFMNTNSQCAEYHVSNSTELQNALNDSGTNYEDDIVKIAQGTYFGNFSFYDFKGYSITIRGGYTSGFNNSELNPSNTILDGGSNDTVLKIENTNYGGNILIEGLTIRNGHYSGGLEVSSWSSKGSAGDITIKNNIITQNTSDTNGGGVMINDSSGPSAQQGDVIFEQNIVTHNTAGYHGGGVYIYYVAESGPAGHIQVKKNIIMDNKTIEHCTGGITIHPSFIGEPKVGPHVLFANNLIVRNTSNSYSGGCLIAGRTTSSTIILHNTISQNTATGICGRGGGLYISGGDNVDLYNNIIWKNTASESGQDIYFEDTVIANGFNNDYSDMDGGWTNSNGNIDADPGFVDPNGGNYHLRSYSPCIDSGTNAVPVSLATDYEGDERVLDGNNDGEAIADIGTDEYVWTPKVTPWIPLLLDDSSPSSPPAPPIIK